MTGLPFVIPGRPKLPLSAKAAQVIHTTAITPDYPKVMSIPMARGRNFTGPRMVPEHLRVAIINQEMAKAYYSRVRTRLASGS